MKSIGLALGSGGARGLVHVSFIQAMDELGIRASVVSGASIGSIIGAFYAAGFSGNAMFDLVESLGFRELSRMVDLSVLGISGLVKGHRVESFLKEHLPATFEGLKCPLHIIATDYWKSDDVIFRSGSLIEAIRASISIPGIFTPVQVKDDVFIDGGLSNPVPYDIIRNQCDLLIAIDVSGTMSCSRKNPVPNMFEAIMGTFHIMEMAMMESKMKVFKPDIYVRPVLKNFQIMDFHRKEEILASVTGDVEKFKRQLSRKLKGWKLKLF